MLASLRRSRFARRSADRMRPVYRRFNPWTGLDGLDRRVVGYLPPGPGVFVEAGANDGLKQSNTYYLERRRGWRGVLVEPVPRRAETCRRNRPGSTVVCAALVPPESDGEEVTLIDVDLMTLVPGARGSQADDEAHLAAGERVQGVQRRTVVSPGRTLSGILDDNLGDRQVDFLSLDLEGFEAPALRGLDLARHAPLWILIETNDVDEIDDVLGSRYRRVAALSHHDWLYERLDAP